MNFNDFNENMTQNQRVPPLIIFKDFTFSKNPFGITWVAWKGAVQYSTWSIPRHICEDWAPVPFGFHFWICRGSLGSARSILQMANSNAHCSRSGTVPFWTSFRDLPGRLPKFTICSTERTLSKPPGQIQKCTPKWNGARSWLMCLGIDYLEY